jgi:hypothetical protein
MQLPTRLPRYSVCLNTVTRRTGCGMSGDAPHSTSGDFPRSLGPNLRVSNKWKKKEKGRVVDLEVTHVNMGLKVKVCHWSVGESAHQEGIPRVKLQSSAQISRPMSYYQIRVQTRPESWATLRMLYWSSCIHIVSNETAVILTRFGLGS